MVTDGEDYFSRGWISSLPARVKACAHDRRHCCNPIAVAPDAEAIQYRELE